MFGRYKGLSEIAPTCFMDHKMGNFADLQMVQNGNARQAPDKNFIYSMNTFSGSYVVTYVGNKQIDKKLSTISHT